MDSNPVDAETFHLSKLLNCLGKEIVYLFSHAMLLAPPEMVQYLFFFCWRMYKPFVVVVVVAVVIDYLHYFMPLFCFQTR